MAKRQDIWLDMASGAISLLRNTLDDMQDYFDGRSERWQTSNAGSEFQEKLDRIDDAISNLEEQF